MVTASEYVQQFRHLRALVIGDAMLDTYLEGEATRLCSEGPVPVVRKTAEYRLPGGAANTAANVRALEAEVIFLSVIGSDLAGQVLRSVLHKCGINDRWLVTHADIQTLHKLRVLANGQYIVRFDEGRCEDAVLKACEAKLLANLDATYALCDVVIISDYRYGVLSPAVINRLKELLVAKPKIVLVDSKALHHFCDLPATIVTPNYLEACQFVEDGTSDVGGVAQNSDASKLCMVERVGQAMLNKLSAEHVAITLGAHGVWLANRAGQTHHLPAHPVAHAHDVGAGDSFAATLALALAAGCELLEASRIGIDAASIAVSRRRTSVVQLQELLQRVSLREYTSQADIPQADIRNEQQLLAAHLEHERRSGRSIIFTNGVFDVLHAGHVQFLRQARSLGDVLVVGINSDSSIRRRQGPGYPVNSERDRVALVSALNMVDAVVLFDEDTPTELIRLLRPHVHVKGSDYIAEALPEAQAVRDVGGQIVILPLADDSKSAGLSHYSALQHNGEQLV